MTTDQLEFHPSELLADHDFAAPLIAGGVVCHGGFDENGHYVSPRTKFRIPAIEAWQANHIGQFGTDLLSLPIDTWPTHYPNVAQAKYLIGKGIPEPIISTLTRIGTVEGFGGMIRLSVVPELQKCFDDDVTGTAMQHLTRGLYEAHARDEAGHEEQAGHNQMWFAARDIAFENPVTEDETARMLERMGIMSPGGTGNVDMQKMLADALARRVLPDDVDFALESLIERMVRLLFIEISAFHAFSWAEEVLSDADLVAGEGEAARIVSYIRADETPHVNYLRTVLTEMRDRTWVSTSGAKYDGKDMIGRIWDRALDESLNSRRFETLDLTMREVQHAIGDRPGAADIFEEFQSLGSVRRLDDGTWVEAPAA